jgi:hypothetical protein
MLSAISPKHTDESCPFDLPLSISRLFEWVQSVNVISKSAPAKSPALASEAFDV